LFLLKAQRDLSDAYDLALAASKHNLGLILSYLLPLHLISSTYPRRYLLRQYPELNTLYAPLFTAIHTGNLRLFNSHLQEYSPIFLRRRVFLAVERSRQCCLRALFYRSVTIYEGTRIPIEVFERALRVSGEIVDREETECFVANMIYRGWIKGYISRERGMVVLSAKEGFPRISGNLAWIRQ
jgi:COP9 signalosome complex subunit 12